MIELHGYGGLNKRPLFLIHPVAIPELDIQLIQIIESFLTDDLETEA